MKILKAAEKGIPLDGARYHSNLKLWVPHLWSAVLTESIKLQNLPLLQTVNH